MSSEFIHRSMSAAAGLISAATAFGAVLGACGATLATIATFATFAGFATSGCFGSFFFFFFSSGTGPGVGLGGGLAVLSLASVHLDRPAAFRAETRNL